MSTPPDFEKSHVDSDQMFDFLHEGAEIKGARANKSRSSKKLVMPIIRTPVPVTESGPAQVGAQTFDTPLDDDLDFLGESSSSPISENIEQDERWNAGVHVNYSEPQPSPIKKFALPLIGVLVLVGGALAYFLFLQPGSVPIDTAFDDQSVEPIVSTAPENTDGTTSAVAQSPQPIGSTSTLFDRYAENLKVLEILVAEGQLGEAQQLITNLDRSVYGYGAVEFGELEQRIARLRGMTEAAGINVETVVETATAAELAGEVEAQQRLAESERLAEAQRLADGTRIAEQARITEELRVAEELRLSEETRAAEELRLAEQARAEQARAEQARLEIAQVAEQARVAEAARQAEQARVVAETRRAEAARVTEQARVTEAARVAQQVRVKEEQRVAEQAQLAESQRIAKATRLAEAKAEAKAEQQRAALARAATAAAARSAEQARTEQLSLALATTKAQERLDQQTASERATDRRLAERERLSRERARATEFAQRQAQERDAARLRAVQAQAALQITPKPRVQSISDEDFNFVAGKFVDLKNAVTNRDINTIIALTQPSGKRIQQMLQIFENSSAVDARISNVASRNADGVIVGQLKIEKLIKNSGAVSAVPANLSTITLKSERGPSGWSEIAW